MTLGVRRQLGRIVGIDVARGVALIAMAATHMLLVVDSDDRSLTAVGWLFAGRASALFAVLAGVSLAIVTGGVAPVAPARDRRRARVTIAVRAALIALLGLVLALVRHLRRRDPRLLRCALPARAAVPRPAGPHSRSRGRRAL